MSEMNFTDISVLCHYLETAEKSALSGLWKNYAASLAFEVFYKDFEAGDKLIGREDLTSADPVELIRALSSEMEKRECESHAFNLLSDELPTLKKRIRAAQVDVCFPLIEQERFTYISNQYERIQVLMGAEYWDNEAGEYRILQNRAQNGPAEDPYELDIATVSRLSIMCKRIAMMGSYSVMPFYSMYPRERERLTFLAGISSVLSAGKLLPHGEMDKAFSSHDEYMERWAPETIARIEEQKELRATPARYTVG